MPDLSEVLEEATQEANAVKSKYDHCDHCKGLDIVCGCQEGCFKPSKSKCFTVHKGVFCDGCGTENIVGSRYKCAECDKYDLCESCYNDEKHGEHDFYAIERVGTQPKWMEAKIKAKSGESTSKAEGMGELKRDDLVLVCELKTAVEFNGRVVDTEVGSGRVDVLVENGRLVRVKRENLRVDVKCQDGDEE